MAVTITRSNGPNPVPRTTSGALVARVSLGADPAPAVGIAKIDANITAVRTR